MTTRVERDLAKMKLAINQQRLVRELDLLGAISAEPAPVTTRVVFTEADLRGRAFVKQLCVEAGLTIREDAVGNTFARWAGNDPGAPGVGTGSHIDAIPNAGRFDGTVGVLGGLEAIRALASAGYRPRRSIELVIFTSEEPTRFGIGCLGSRMMAGTTDAVSASLLRDREGLSLDAVRSAAHFSGELSSVRLPSGFYSAFVELHIEQGPILEQRNLDAGVVTAIAAPASLKIEILGEGGHAGAVLMPDRHDAFLAAAEIGLALESAVKATGSVDTVGTVGVCDVFPGAVNSIPSRVRMEIDVRDIDPTRRDAVLDKISSAGDEIASRRGVKIKIALVNADPPAQCDSFIVETLAGACVQHGISHQRMISRAYHDSLFISRIAPTAMLFIPCRGGVSHRPDEYSSPEAIAKGALVLAQTLAGLAA
jgi:ureidoglycolate amidohydrolase